ncbi:2EXR family [Microdochium nivale]|nr:2EXR family [Microdochium nivale]
MEQQLLFEDATATTFSKFPLLPAELRMQIWGLAAHQRVVRLNIAQPGYKETKARISTSYPPPAVMHTCRESRLYGPYQKAFISTRTGEHVPSYVWVNFAFDMLVLSDTSLAYLSAHYADIQRLQFTLPGNEYSWQTFLWACHESLKPFRALRELRVASGYNVTRSIGFSSIAYCASERDGGRFLCPRTGMLLTPGELRWAAHLSMCNSGLIHNDEMERYYLPEGEEEPGHLESWIKQSERIIYDDGR